LFFLFHYVFYLPLKKFKRKTGVMKMKKKNTVKNTCTKAEYKKAPDVCSKEQNLRKLAKSGKLECFVRKNKGCWNHQEWLVLCAEIEEECYEPIDFDQVGLILENLKAE